MSFLEKQNHTLCKLRGREPLAPLIDINTVIPNIPKELVKCLSIRYLNHLIGYIWLFEKSETNYYILHMYVSKKYRKLGLGTLAVHELDNYYLDRGFLTAELLVSGSNYLGLKFWTSVGFDKIIYVEAPEENAVTSSVELELKKELNSYTQKQRVYLIPITDDNKILGQSLNVTDEQVEAKLILNVPEAIEAAEERPKCARPFFIRLNNTIIGYTAFVFDEEIGEERLRYWLWQFMIDEKYQNKGYASLALEEVIKYFKYKDVQYITLSTTPTNNNALHLYKKFGFYETGEMNDEEVMLQKKLY